jgi:hypothetical protein
VNKLIYIHLVKFVKNRFFLCVKMLIRFLFLFPVNIIGHLFSNRFFVISDLLYFDCCFCKICYRL